MASSFNRILEYFYFDVFLSKSVPIAVVCIYVRGCLDDQVSQARFLARVWCGGQKQWTVTKVIFLDTLIRYAISGTRKK